jgi:hypothetical protein
LRSSLLCLPVKSTLSVYISNMVAAALHTSTPVPCDRRRQVSTLAQKGEVARASS